MVSLATQGSCFEVMTGFFCSSAIKAAESDHEMVVQSLVQTRQEHGCMCRLHCLFLALCFMSLLNETNQINAHMEYSLAAVECWENLLL